MPVDRNRDRLVRTSFLVQIDLSGEGADSRVDHLTPAEWVQEDPDNNDFPTSLANSQNKEYANIRFEEIMKAVGERNTPIVHNIESTGTTDDDPAETLSFVLAYDREEAIETRDDNNPGQFIGNRRDDQTREEILSGDEPELGIERMIARILATEFVKVRQVHNPENSGATSSGTAVIGPQILEVTAPAIYVDFAAAEAAGVITVTQLSPPA